jgi:aryl-alcohol dehydrogenase-like predicted oxidoreductase
MVTIFFVYIGAATHYTNTVLYSQVPYSVIARRAGLYLSPYCERKGTAILANLNMNGHHIFVYIWAATHYTNTVLYSQVPYIMIDQRAGLNLAPYCPYKGIALLANLNMNGHHIFVYICAATHYTNTALYSQVPYSVIDRRAGLYLAPYCQRKGSFLSFEI